MLRINPYTVDRVSSLSPVSQLPLHFVARAREQVQSAKRRKPPARKQPETGPALGIVGVMSVAVALFLSRKSSK